MWELVDKLVNELLGWTVYNCYKPLTVSLELNTYGTGWDRNLHLHFTVELYQMCEGIAIF